MAKARNFYDRAVEAYTERHRKRPTQDQLAKALGVSQPVVSQDYKANGGYPSMDKIVAFALETGFCVEWLITERGPRKVSDAQITDRYLPAIIGSWQSLSDDERRKVARFANYVKDEHEPK